MELSSVGNEIKINWDLLLSRYPNLSFLLSCGDADGCALFEMEQNWLNARMPDGSSLHQSDIGHEIQNWKDSLDLTGIDILYVYGIGLGYYYKAMQSWLRQRRERVLVFFEDNLSVLDALFRTEIGEVILEDPQVHIFYISHPSEWESVLDECVQRFLGDRIEVTALQSYRERFRLRLNRVRMKLFRKATVVHAFLAEALHYHLLMKNLIANFSHLPVSFHANAFEGKFKDIPVIICGAGPSLAEAIPFLKEMEQKAILIAGGSTITALSRYGIRPHIAMALDPNHEEYLRLKPNSSFEMPFLYSSRVHKDVFQATNAQLGYLCSDTGGVFETWMHEQMDIQSDAVGPDLGIEALSVTTIAVPLARSMGCNPIIFCGVDLAYTGMKRYAPGVMESSEVFLEEMKKDKRAMERLVRKKDKDGKMIYTLVKWVMEASCIGQYAKKHADVLFFNATEKGLPIPHVKTAPLAEIIKEHCKNSYDLRGLIHTEGELARFTAISADSLKESYQRLCQSLEICVPLIEEMVFEIEARLAFASDPSVSLESGRMSLIEMDLQEQVAYEALLQLAFPAYQRLLERIYPSIEPEESAGYRTNYLEKKRHLWSECLKVAQGCLDLIRQYL